METRPSAHAGAHPATPAVTPAILPVPKLIGPAVEQRPDHLVYVRGSGLPYTGKSTLLDENGKKTYEGSFQNGRREGVGVEWYASGQKKADGDFRAGNIYEGSLFWYFIGTFQKKMQVNYRAGKVVDAHLWNRDGSLRW
jgi:antitoxin component YwqK of YwqJK toxin-antitoxin module